MKKLFGKLKNGQQVVVFDDTNTDKLKDIYKIPNVKGAIPFEIDTRKLAEGEWYFVIPTEEQKESMLGEYVSESSDAACNVMHPDYYREISVVYVAFGAEKIFTKVGLKNILRTQKYITFDDKSNFVEQANSLMLTGEIDAYWDGTRLFFKRFASIRSLFPGIQKMYKEITEKETNEFLSSPLFELKEEMSSDFISLANRKKIASIIDGKSVDLADTDLHRKYIAYAEEYNLDLEIKEGKIALIDNTDIGKVIDLLGEKFYTTEINGEKREIRSSRKMVNDKRKRAR